MRGLFYLCALVVMAGAFFMATDGANAGPALDQALQTHCGRTTCMIRDNPGGDIAIFQAAAQEVLDEGKHLVIDGFCASACVVLADLARQNTCITSDAQFAVHKASVIEVTGQTIVDGHEVPVGRLIRKENPPQSADIDKWIRGHGGYPSDGLNVIPVKDALQFWSPCR
jgi:hypothetical protein